MHSFRRTGCRLAGVVFTVCALALFLTPHAADWEFALSTAAVLTGGLWIYCVGRWRRRRY